MKKIINYYENVLASNKKNIKNKDYLEIYNQFVKLKYPKGQYLWDIPRGSRSYKYFTQLVEKLIAKGYEDKVVEILYKDSQTFQDLIDFYKVHESNEYKKIMFDKMMTYYLNAFDSMEMCFYVEEKNKRNRIELELSEFEKFNNRNSKELC